MIKTILKKIVAADYAFIEAHQNPVEITPKMRKISSRYHKLRPIYDEMCQAHFILRKIKYALSTKLLNLRFNIFCKFQKVHGWVKDRTRLTIRVISPSLVTEFDLSDDWSRTRLMDYVLNFKSPKKGAAYPHYKYRLHFGKRLPWNIDANKHYQRLQAKLKKLEVGQQ